MSWITSEEIVAKLTSKGQITIPQQVRQKLEVHAGDRISFKINDHGQVVVAKMNDDLMERILLMVPMMTDKVDVILIDGSTQDLRRQLLDEILSEIEFDQEFLWSDQQVEIPSLPSIGNLYYSDLEEFVNCYEEDYAFVESKLILIYGSKVDFDELSNLKKKGFTILLVYEEANLEDIFAWDADWYDYPNEKEKLSLLYISLSNDGAHQMKYCINQAGKMIKEKVIIG